MIIFFLFLIKSQSTTLLQHKFSENFGEIFYDFSDNERVSINGLSSTTKLKNVISTDRGIYFPLGDSTVTMPPNEFSTFSDQSSCFSITFWCLAEDYSFFLIYLKSTQSTLYLRRYSVNQNLALRLVSGSFDSSENFSSGNSFVYGMDYIGKWTLVIIFIGNTVKLTINQSVLELFNVGFSVGLDEFTGFSLGKKDSTTGFVGFVYNFYVTDQDSGFSEYLDGASNVCLKDGCSSCTLSVVEDGVSGCLPVVMNPYKDSLGNACTSCVEGCSQSKCLTCSSCAFNTCVMDSLQIICKCPAGSTYLSSTCKCNSDRYQNGLTCKECNSDCATCDSSEKCLTCIADNSEIFGSGCVCKTNYYNISALTAKDSCIKCRNECKNCDSSGNCLSCKDPAADITKNCICASGYYLDNSCTKCYAECVECSSFGVCTSCIAVNSSPKSFGCQCLEGYGSSSLLISADSCVKCADVCITCQNPSTCKSCKDSNSLPPSCDCKDGFYLSNAVCTSCPINCKKCDEISCIECWDELAYPSSNDCICGNGTYSSQANPLICKNCRDDCKTCSDSKTCDECLIKGAVKKTIGCSCDEKYYSNSVSCVKCETWNEKSKNCVFCEINEYFLDGKCATCPNLCTECTAIGCLDCVEHAKLNENVCKCEDMYEGVSECSPKDFFAEVSVYSLKVQIAFTVDLKVPLKSSAIKLLIPSQSFSFSVKQVNLKYYILTISLSQDLLSSINCKLSFSREIISIFNQTLDRNSYSFYLPASQSALNDEETKKAFTATTQSNFYTAFSITIFLSIVNFNFVSMWNFLNSVQILVYIRLINTDLPLKFSTILQALRECTKFFNVFEYFIDSDDFFTFTGLFFDFGFENSSFFLNQGHLLEIFIIVLFNYGISSFLKMMQKYKICQITFIKETIDDFHKSFKYSAFIRYMIQTYLDFGVSCALTLSRISVTSPNEVINLIICLILSIYILLVPIKSILFTLKQKESIKTKNQELLDEYGSLFYEFTNDQSLMSSYFYSFFFIRRFLYILILFSLTTHPNIQLLLSICLNLLVTFK